MPIAAPPEGTNAATTDQGGPGSHVLYQDVALEAGSSHTLSFVVYYENRSVAFATPPTLDYAIFNPNQQYRIDIMKPTAPVTSVAAGDVLATVLQTDVGDPLSLAPTAVSFDLSPFAGQTVRVRFAEVDNQRRPPGRRPVRGLRLSHRRCGAHLILRAARPRGAVAGRFEATARPPLTAVQPRLFVRSQRE